VRLLHQGIESLNSNGIVNGIAKDVTEEKVAKEALQRAYLEIKQHRERLPVCVNSFETTTFRI
jgi:hypothetical protein